MSGQDSLDRYLQKLQGQRCAIVGLGISNRPLLARMAKAGLTLHAFDQMQEDSDAARALEASYAAFPSVHFHWGPEAFDALLGFDLIVRTPQLLPSHPALQKAAREGAQITSEMALFFHLCPAEIYGITGSDGKTTTSTLLALVLEAQGKRVHLGGNIGKPLLDSIAEIKASDKVVVELSSFQLMDLPQSPANALLTNVSPNHLDVHHDLLEYEQAKAQIFRHQGPEDRLVLNGNCPVCRGFAQTAKAKILWTQSRPPGRQEASYHLEGSRLLYNDGQEDIFLADRSQIKALGIHNAYNVLNVAALLDLKGPSQALDQVLQSFEGVAHRLEAFHQAQGVRYYNSSIDSSPQRSIQSLAAFDDLDGALYLIAGGKDKACDYTGLGAAIAKTVSKLYLCGANAEQIRAILAKESSPGQNIPVMEVPDYETALAAIRKEARPGDAVLLSPAGTSFDRYRNFMERGQAFKALVSGADA